MIWCISPLCLSIINILETSIRENRIIFLKENEKRKSNSDASLKKAPSWTFIVFYFFILIFFILQQVGAEVSGLLTL